MDGSLRIVPMLPEHRLVALDESNGRVLGWAAVVRRGGGDSNPASACAVGFRRRASPSVGPLLTVGGRLADR